jgi:hypothetical protein
MDVNGNSKLQIPNNKQITMTEIPNSKPYILFKNKNSKHVWVIENATASAFPATCCGVSERTTIKWNLFLTFRRFPARRRRTAGSFNIEISNLFVIRCLGFEISQCGFGTADWRLKIED